MANREEILTVSGVSIRFSQYAKGFAKADFTAIRDMHLRIHAGEMVAVVGSSGSGKSLLAHAIMDILPYNASLEGEMLYRDEPLTRENIRRLRGSEIVLVPQSVAYLDPLMKTGAQVRKGRRDGASRQAARAALARYGLGKEIDALYPFQLSGGMARRVLIATAAMGNPKLVIADEPTPGLHESAARRVLGHFREIADAGAAVLLITHDLELALEVADRIAVFYAGVTVEDASTEDFISEETLRHPYTRALWRAMPRNGFRPTPGGQPYVGEMWTGCPYAPRCPRVQAPCQSPVPYAPVRGGHARCLFADAEGPA